MDGMNKNISCSTDKVGKWIRIALSLAIITAGIVLRNWIGLLGIIPLITALTGGCGFSLRLNRSIHETRRDDELE